MFLSYQSPHAPLQAPSYYKKVCSAYFYDFKRMVYCGKLAIIKNLRCILFSHVGSHGRINWANDSVPSWTETLRQHIDYFQQRCKFLYWFKENTNKNAYNFRTAEIPNLELPTYRIVAKRTQFGKEAQKRLRCSIQNAKFRSFATTMSDPYLFKTSRNAIILDFFMLLIGMRPCLVLPALQ